MCCVPTTLLWLGGTYIIYIFPTPEPSPTDVKPAVEAPPPQPVQTQPPPSSESQALLDLLRRYPVVWQGHLTLKNEAAAVQLHYLTGNLELAKLSLPTPPPGQATPGLRILKRMRLEATQLEGVEKRMQVCVCVCVCVCVSVMNSRWAI